MFKISRRFTQIDYLKVFVRILAYKHSVITKKQGQKLIFSLEM